MLHRFGALGVMAAVAALTMVIACGGESAPSVISETATPADTVAPTASPTDMLTPKVNLPAPTETLEARGTPRPDLEATVEARIAATIAARPTSASVPAPTPAPTSTPVPAPTPIAELSSAEIYERIAPSIPFIETPAATGSGVLLKGGYVLTNYHVVWPYEAAWVVFPDGTELQDVPVVAWDPMADLAVLGPVVVSAPPLELRDGEGMDVGSALYLVGYPAEVDLFPQPSITRGILSRFRQWEQLGMTYFQTDAAIAGGQSGGVVVNSKGEVIGISGLVFSEAGFGLAASSADIAPMVEPLIGGQDVSGLGDRRLPMGRGSFKFDVELRNYWDVQTFALEAAAGTIFEAEIDGLGDGWFHVSDPFGPLLEVDNGYIGVEYGRVELLTNGIHFLQVEMASGEASSFELSSSVRLKPLTDPDDGRAIEVGETVAGSLDYFFDWDWYSIRLTEGETVSISTDSFNVDTVIYVDFPNSRGNQVVSDDHSGGGLFGLDAELVYRAPKTGEYYIAVTEAVGDGFGGYYLSVEGARAGTETVVVPPSPQVVSTRFGDMIVYEGLLDDVSVQLPAYWIEVPPTEEDYGITFWATSTNLEQVLITEEDTLVLGLGEMTLDEYADAVEFTVSSEPGVQVLSRRNVRTARGFPAIRLELSVGHGTFSGVRLVSIQDRRFGFSITYMFPNDTAASISQLAEYSFSTFHIE